MSRLSKIISLVLVIVCISVSFCGCGDKKEIKKVKPYIEPDTVQTLDSGVVSENEKFILKWDNDRYAILLENKKNDYVWSSIPYDFLKLENTEGFGKVNMESPVIIEYIDTQYSQIKEAFGFVESVLNGWVSSEEVDGGIRVTYYCTDIEISVPVEYRLCEDGIEVRLIIEDICEGKNPVYSVSVAPYMCSAKANTDSYLFIPSGSGALMSVDDGKRAAREFKGRVYGEDVAASKHEKISNEQQVNLPVFGVKNIDNAMLAVIETGADIASITAKAGDSEIGYANAYTTFYVRGSDENLITDVTGYKTSIVKYTADLVDMSYASIKYMPVEGSADYSGMANLYREYIIEKYSIEKNKTESTPLHLKILGAGTTQKNILGVKYNSLVPISDYSETLKIIKEINNMGVNPVVELQGYCESGVDSEKIAGGFSLASCLGTKKERTKLQDYCKKNNVTLLWDFDVISFTKSGNGVSKLKDSAKTANGVRAQINYYYPTVFVANSKIESKYIVERSLIAEVVEELIQELKEKNISAVSLNTLGNISYSDYSSSSGYAKAGYSEIVASELEKVTKDLTLACESPNEYAAVNCDYIMGSPIVSSQNIGFDYDVPFYQMIFKGIIPISISPINYSSEPKDSLLTAIETGSSLCFSLSYDDSNDYYGLTADLVKFSSYTQWKDTIKDYVSDSKEFLSLVSDATVLKHSRIKEGVTKTEFSNGVIVIVNKTDERYSSEIGVVEGKNFVFNKGVTD